LEGSAQWVKNLAQLFPLTHFLKALRLIINDGATLSQVSSEIMILSVMSLICLGIGSWFFSWTR